MPNEICAWSKSNKRSRGPFAVRRARRPFVAFGVICPPCASRGILCWLPSLLVKYCPLLGHLGSYLWPSLLIFYGSTRKQLSLHLKPESTFSVSFTRFVYACLRLRAASRMLCRLSSSATS